jgi:hypothetical protein
MIRPANQGRSRRTPISSNPAQAQLGILRTGDVRRASLRRLLNPYHSDRREESAVATPRFDVLASSAQRTNPKPPGRVETGKGMASAMPKEAKAQASRVALRVYWWTIGAGAFTVRSSDLL